MRAKVLVYDDEDNNFVGEYHLMPCEELDNGISTKYVFKFEYNKLNRNLLLGGEIKWEG